MMMKRIISLVISLIMITEISFCYTSSVKVNGFGGQSTSEEGRVVRIIPKVEVSEWDVKSGNVTVVNNQFTMPAANVEIEGVLQTAATYTITYNANNGTGAPGNQIKTEGEALTLSSTIPTREGYNFLGWSKNSGAVNAEYSPGGSFTEDEDTTLYAVWSISSYTLTVNPGGATYGGDYNTTKQITAPAQSNTVTYNYNGSGQSNSTATANKTFASWTKTGGGSISSTTANPTTYTYGTSNGTLTASYTNGSVTLPSAERSGYTFLGWSTNSEATSAEYSSGESFTVSGDITLYAVWEVNIIPLDEIPVGAYIAYNPVYTKNGSQVTTATVLGTDAGTLDTDNVTGIDQTFNFNDYTGGWKVMYNDGNQLTLIAAESVGTLTLGTAASGLTSETDPRLNGGKIGYAKAIYTLNKLCNDYAKGEYAVSGRCPGYGNGPDNLLEEGIDLDDITHANIEVGIPDDFYPYRDSHNQAETDYIIDTQVDGNYVLRHSDSSGYVWLASRTIGSTSGVSHFSVLYLTNYHDVGVVSALYYRTETSTSHSSAVQNGVRPIITLDSGVQIVGGDGLTPETAYGLAWETAPTYTISYNANGGSGAPSSQTKSSGTAITLSSTVPTRSGYNFLGWSTDSTATSAEYSAGGSFAQNANTTLYAIWESQLPTLASVVNVGDYVTYTPSSTSYTVSTSESGYSGYISDQTFNPSATTSWRVFSIEGDIVKLVSADKVQTSSNADLSLTGATGYQNAVKTLNDLCGAYVNSEYATSGRSIGSTDTWSETEVDSTKSLGVINTDTYPLTWTNTYTNGNTGFPYIDSLYSSDVTILKNNSMLHTDGYTWLASRNLYAGSGYSRFYVCYLDTSGAVESSRLYTSNSNGVTSPSSTANGVRPVITLKSGIKKASGSGTEASPYIISQ